MPRSKKTEADDATPLGDSCECGCGGKCAEHGGASGHGDETTTVSVPNQPTVPGRAKPKSEAEGFEEPLRIAQITDQGRTPVTDQTGDEQMDTSAERPGADKQRERESGVSGADKSEWEMLTGDERQERLKDILDAEEVLAPFPSELEILNICDIKYHPSLPIHDHKQDTDDEAEEATEVYDVDSKIYSVWYPSDDPLSPSPGCCYLVDGHHHLRDAQTATHFVSSSAGKGRLVSCKPRVPAWCYYERDGWTLPLIQKLSFAMNFDSKKAVTVELEPFGPKHPLAQADSVTGNWWENLPDGVSVQFNDSDIPVTDSQELQYELIADAKDGVLGKARQLITFAGRKTKHGFRYPAAVLNDAVERANQRARAGTVLGEKHHPGLVSEMCDRHGCGPRFADNFDKKTSRWTNFERVGKDGSVWATREILDTAEGREIHARLQAKQPVPLSVRWLARNPMTIGDAKEPQWLELITVDDVDIPAMDGAGEVAAIFDSLPAPTLKESWDRWKWAIDMRAKATADAATDAEANRRAQMNSSDTMTDLNPERDTGLGPPFYGMNQNTANPHDWDEADPVFNSIANHEAGTADSYDFFDLFPQLVSITDSVEPGSKPTDSVSDSLENPQEKQMPTAISIEDSRKAVRAFALAARRGASKGELKTLDAKAVRALMDCYQDAIPDSDFTPLMTEYAKAVIDGQEAGYHASESGPYIELGNMIGVDPREGYAPDMRSIARGKDEKRNVQQKTDTKEHNLAANLTKASGDSDDEEDEEKKKKREMKEKEKSIEAKMDSLLVAGHSACNLSDGLLKTIRRQIISTVTDEADVEKALSDAVEAISGTQAHRKAQELRLYGDAQTGHTINTANPMGGSRVSHEARPDQAAFERLQSIADDYQANMTPGAGQTWVNPYSPATKARRKANVEKAQAVIDDVMNYIQENSGKKDKFFAALTDSMGNNIDVDSQLLNQIQAISDSYGSSVSNFPNQPTIMRWMLTQAFQDQRMLQFVMPQGPGQGSDGGNGWVGGAKGLGRVFRLAYETYQDPTGYGEEFGSLDYGLLTPENAGITEGTINLYWDNFSPLWKKIATSATIEGLKSIGNGPLNYGAMGRNLWHMSARKSRTIDTALANEMANIAMEYGATVVTTDTYTTGNNQLTNNSVYQNGSATVPGAPANSVVVNLNPAKVANAAIAYANGLPTDDYICYPTPFAPANPAGNGLTPVAGIRLLAGQVTTNNAAPYFGTNKVTKNPIVPPRNLLTITAAGADQTSVMNPITVTAPANMVLGQVGPDGLIYPPYTNPSAVPTCAVDWLNGVLLFTAGAGLANSGTLINTTVTLSAYSYTTNFDVFPATPGINGLVTLATGETPAAYENRLLTQMDQTAAGMASWSKYVAPDLMLMAPQVAAQITSATAFYKLNSPKETVLYPSEDFFATRNGVDMARINTPWWPGQGFILITRRESTRYAIDTPFEIRGPYVKYDTNGNVIAGEGYYGAENSAIFTPQVKNATGTIINPVARFILMITGGTAI